MSKVRPLTQHVYESLKLDEWPGPAGIVDFGLESTIHYGALQWAVRYDGVTPEQLDAALGSGPKIQALISERNPYRQVQFKTAYDDMQLELELEVSCRQPDPEKQPSHSKGKQRGIEREP